MKDKLRNLFEEMKVRSRYKPMWEIINMIEPLVNQEVEKRIAERMPSMEETINMATEYVNHKSLHKANKGLIRDAVIIGIGMVRSRLTQKTEGEENG